MKLPIIKTRIQTRYSDTDGLGHISNEAYISFMQVGRLEFLAEVTRQTGVEQASVVANLNIDYFRECFYGDEIDVSSWCSRVGTKSFTICHQIYANGVLVAKGCATNVGFDPETRRSQPLPKGWEPSDAPPAGKPE